MTRHLALGEASVTTATSFMRRIPRSMAGALLAVGLLSASLPLGFEVLSGMKAEERRTSERRIADGWPAFDDAALALLLSAPTEGTVSTPASVEHHERARHVFLGLASERLARLTSLERTPEVGAAVRAGMKLRQFALTYSRREDSGEFTELFFDFRNATDRTRAKENP